ncbi:hypothetical protein MKW98_023839, partial [Papaver atlanticum]
RRPIQRRDKLPHPAFRDDEIGQGSIFVKGSLYWYVTDYILCFDVTTERFNLIWVPKTPLMCGVSMGHSMLIELDKSLCFIIHDISSEILHIYKMQKGCVDEENLWKGFSIDVSLIGNLDSYYIQPLCVRSKKIYLRSGDGLVCYDAVSQELIAPVFSVRADDSFHFVAYTKSIVCLKELVGSSLVSILSDSYL